MKKLFLSILLVLSLLCLSGCSNYHELNDLAIVSAMGIEKEDNKYKVTLELYKEVKESNSGSASKKSESVTGLGKSIEEAIKNERAYLSDIKVNADIVIDTSLLSARQLKSRITEEFSNGNSKSMSITCVSFGFKYGLPTDADLVFDARCLPNPFYIDELKNLTGLSEPVKSFLEEKTEWKSWADNLFSFIDYSIPLYMAEGKSNLVIAVGCTGGKHRSVATAQMLYEHLKDTCERVVVSHRDISKL